MRRVLLAAVVLLLACVTGSLAEDIVRTAGPPITGEIKKLSPTEVTIEKANRTQTIPVNEIESIRFDSEPAELNQVRAALERGAFQGAVNFLGKIAPGDVKRAAIKEDIAYYQALVMARRALSGESDLDEAGKAIQAFIKDHPKNYHFLAANEVLGDLLVAKGAYAEAEAIYKLVEETAPWVDYKMRAGIAQGRALLQQDKSAEAAAVFDAVINLGKDAEGELVAQQRMMATVGRANCLARTGQYDEGVKLVEALIGEADGEEAELHALAYNALGNCHRQAGRNKEAMLAFLHVDRLFSNYPELHAEALYNLAELWKELGHGDRALECRNLLEERYASSEWATK